MTEQEVVADTEPAAGTEEPRTLKELRIVLEAPHWEPYTGTFERITSKTRQAWYFVLAALRKRRMIQPSDADAGSPAYFTANISDCLDPMSWTEGKALHGDWRGLNAAMPAPRAVRQRLLDWMALERGGVISRIDLRCGYLRMRIHRDDRRHTTFHTPFGCYEWLVAPYGLAGVPAAFRDALADLLDVPSLRDSVAVRLDEVLVWGKDVEAHNAALEATLRILDEADLEPEMGRTTLCDTLAYRTCKDGAAATLPQPTHDAFHVPVAEDARKRLFAGPLRSSAVVRGLLDASHDSFANKLPKASENGRQVDPKSRGSPKEASPMAISAECAMRAAAAPAPRFPVLHVRCSDYMTTYLLVQRVVNGACRVVAAGHLLTSGKSDDASDAECIAALLGYLRPLVFGLSLEVVSSRPSLRSYVEVSRSDSARDAAEVLAEYGAFLRRAAGRSFPAPPHRIQRPSSFFILDLCVVRSRAPASSMLAPAARVERLGIEGKRDEKRGGKK